MLMSKRVMTGAWWKEDGREGKRTLCVVEMARVAKKKEQHFLHFSAAAAPFTFACVAVTRKRVLPSIAWTLSSPTFFLSPLPLMIYHG